MELRLVRDTLTTKSTIGSLYIDDIFQCFTLEDCVRDVKIPKVTAIPYGRYEVVVNFSNRFQRLLPLLLNVPNFEGIRIHSGNRSEDTEGCILTGTTKGVDMVGNSRVAFEPLFTRLRTALETQKVFITIEKAPEKVAKSVVTTSIDKMSKIDKLSKPAPKV